MSEKKTAFLYIGTFFLFILLSSILTLLLDESMELYQIWSLLAAQLSLLAGLYICKLFLKLPQKNVLAKKDSIVSVFAYAVLPFLSLILVFCFSDINNIILALFEKIGLKGSMIDFVWNTPSRLILTLFIVALLPAFVEELFIRGYLLDKLNNLRPAYAVLISAALFAILHMNPMQLLYQFMFGIILAVFVKISKRLDYSILLHFFNNAIVIIYTYFIHDEAEITLDSSAVFKAIGLSAAGVIGIIICLALFSHFISCKKNNAKILKQNIKVSLSDLYNSSVGASRPPLSKESKKYLIILFVAMTAIWILNAVLMAVAL